MDFEASAVPAKCLRPPIIRLPQFLNEENLGLPYRAHSRLRKMRMFLPVIVGALGDSNGFADGLDGVSLREQFTNLLLQFRIEN
jgi:hypothetical protein